MRKKRFVILALTAATGIGGLLVAATVSGAGPNDNSGAQAVAAVRAGQGRVLPGQPEEVTYSMWWQDCRFVFGKSKTTEEQAPNGMHVGLVDPPETLPDQAADAAQDHACVPHRPTADEIQAAQEHMAALRGNNGRPAGAPAPPSLPPPR